MQKQLIIKRAERKISKRKMASLLGISEQAYAQKEANIRPFNINEAFYLSKFFGISIENLFEPFDTKKCKVIKK